MGFFSCLVGCKKLKGKKKCETSDDTAVASSSNASIQASAGSSVGDRGGKSPVVVSRPRKPGAASFSFRELAVASQNFRPSNLIGEGGFGKVFKGYLETGEAVAIKQLNPDGLQGSKEFLVEVLMLIVLRHRNLVNLIGFCTDGDEKLLVYEYLAKGSLEKHLFDLPLGKEPLEWNTRIKIALGAANGLEYLHDVADPPVIYRDLKSANILLDEEFNPKLSDFGLAKLAPVGDKTHISTRVMGTFGYCAPDYAMSGRLTVKSDIYSFGVVLLELITGRKAYDSSKGCLEEQNLILWCRPFLSVRRKFIRLADPLLRGRFPLRQFYQLVVVTSMCLQEQPMYRPAVHDVVVALEHVASVPYIEEDGGSSTPSPWFTPSPHDVNGRCRTMN